MALDLLSHEPIAHQYRHDLESFFYVLCYFVAQFRPANLGKNTPPSLAFLPEWEVGSTQDLFTTKQKFLLRDDCCDALFKNADPSFRPLIARWITPFREEIFERVPRYTSGLINAMGPLDSAKKKKNERKIQNLLKELQAVGDLASSNINYEAFKEILST